MKTKNECDGNPQTRNIQCAKSGFTLIELLIVIVIIVILAAILFPVFATAREKSRQSACASNEKQIGIALLQYVEDFDERYPCGTELGVAYADHGSGWAKQVFPYVKSYPVYICPDDEAVSGHSGPYLSYIGNANIFGSTTQLSKLNAPTLTVLMTEMAGYYDTLTDTYLYDQTPTWNGLDYDFQADGDNNVWGASSGYNVTGWLNGATYSSDMPKLGRHSNGSNVLFADCHVKWLMGGTISPGYNASNQNSAQVPGNWGSAAGTGVGAYAATFSAI